MITLAYLLGSDYTEGLEGVGIVSAMEFLRDFPGEGVERLKQLREWHTEANSKPALVMKESGLRKKLVSSSYVCDYCCYIDVTQV